MSKSETIGALAAALSEAQAEIKPAAFNATNPFLKNKYADLGSVIEAAREPLRKHGLSISQQVISYENSIGITTILMHKSGEWLESTVFLPLGDEKGKSQAQVAGSIITYLRRYSLASALGMYADEDTDGGTVQPAQNKPAQAKPTFQPAPPTNGNGAMTLAEAMEVTNSEGEKYGDLQTDKLSQMANGIGRVKEQTAEHKRKLLAIQTILKARAETK
jgi:hypothetical protein